MLCDSGLDARSLPLEIALRQDQAGERRPHRRSGRARSCWAEPLGPGPGSTVDATGHAGCHTLRLDDAQGLIPEGEDCGYLEFMASIDVIVMGRHTFEQVLTFDPWPYGTTAASPSRASCVPACSMKSPSRSGPAGGWSAVVRSAAERPRTDAHAIAGLRVRIRAVDVSNRRGGLRVSRPIALRSVARSHADWTPGAAFAATHH